ncbi:hypothetical protein F1B92_04285 [Campylobacter sp. FMV-PI01]|uniref:DUF4868 domain-containing protein n=1 Tax=Campylobacter portucalensis TaxID=2608384 RepID=A0A6L5WK63_9BACT|nr:hypothetical protein [Campylobacter portucalensis]MSN96405.1 hypothetical protein [Campylobacter portucalensis]
MNSKLMATDKHNFYSVFGNIQDETNIKNDNEIFFNKIDISNEYKYLNNPDRMISKEDNEWFFVDFNSIDFRDEILEIFNIFNNTGSYPNLSRDDFKKIKHFVYGFIYENNHIINIQNVKNGNFIKNKTLLKVISNNVKYEKAEQILTFYNEVDIFIDRNNEKIYFQDFKDLKYFNNKFLAIYKEAIEEDSANFKEFVNSNISLFSVNIPHNKIRNRNSKKLKYVLDNNMLDGFIGKENIIREYINTYNISTKLKYENDKFIIDENKDLTSLIEIIFEQHYTGAITEQHLLASGNEIVENNS